MKMTYFKKPDHSYNRVIFEFTDEEKQAAGFHKTSKEPAMMEILRLLHRIADTQIKADITDILHSFTNVETLEIPFDENDIEEKSIQDHVNSFINSNQLLPKIHEQLKIIKRYEYEGKFVFVNLIRLDELLRKKDAWKAKALRLIDFLNNKDKEIKWLLDNYVLENRKRLCKEEVIEEMQQALKEVF